MIKFKNLARAITITTLNSTVQFDACIEASFKIKNQYFKVAFYLVDTPSHSAFKAILGYDFLYKNHALINPKDQTLIIKDISYPFLTSNFSTDSATLPNDIENRNLQNINSSADIQTVPKIIEIGRAHV